jgi:hypothetical protein
MAADRIWSNTKARAQASADRVRAALAAAKSRTGGEGRLVALSAGGMGLAFVLLAALAPVLMQAPSAVANAMGMVLLVLVFLSTMIGAVAIWRIVRAGIKDEQTSQTAMPYSQSVIEAALSDAEDAGLKQIGARLVDDAITGRQSGHVVAVMRLGERAIAVVRLKQNVPATLLVSPGEMPWPFAFPREKNLTPIAPPAALNAQAWTGDRDKGSGVLARLAPALLMSAAAGEVPFVSARGKALVFLWQRGDVGTGSVIAAEAIKAFL